jgi:hypothetical protein
VLAIASTEDSRSQMYKQGMLPAPKGSADFKEAIARDAVLNRDLIQSIGSKLD